MTVTDPLGTCSSDASSSVLVNNTINALSDLLQGVQLSEDHAVRIIGAVRAITTKSSDIYTPTHPLPTTSEANLSLVAPSADDALPVQDNRSEIVDDTAKVPSAHNVVAYKGIHFLLPFQGESEPFYLVTKGKMIGVISNWEKASPMVSRVSGAIYRKLQSGATISQGRRMVEDAIDDGVVKVVGPMPLLSVSV